MISIEKAIEIAQKEVTEYPVYEIMDLQDRWGVSFDSGDVPEPGIPVVTVDKSSGKTDFLTIPPIEHLHIINTAKIVWSANGG